MIEVRISQRVLWIGTEAYPLQNIARAQTIELAPRRLAALERFAISIAAWIVLGLVAVVAGIDYVGAMLFVFALIILSGIRFIKNLMEQTLYALIIETAGSPRAALVTLDASQVTDLVRAIMHAINNPQAELKTLVQNIHAGDKIQQFGSHNTGKVSL